MRIDFLNLLFRYFNTLKYLKFIQFLGLFKKYLPKNKVVCDVVFKERQTLIKWDLPLWRNSSQITERKFNFLHLEKEIDYENGGDNISKLWLYNFHYFDSINSKNKTNTLLDYQYIYNWINAYKNIKSPAWDPYPTSLRIVNWIKWILRGNKANVEIKKSLIRQVKWLYKNIEYHLLANHIWANAKALCFAGLFFEGEEAEKWFKKGLKIIKNEIKEQCLKDGGHIERSPMYHSIFLEDLLEIIYLNKIYENYFDQLFIKDLLVNSKKMILWLINLSHSDGKISFFNDSAFDIACPIKELIEIYNIVSTKVISNNLNTYRSIHLKYSGFVRLQKSEIICLCDVGSIGPDYMPGHAHAETLSFEVSYKGQRIFVNSGISTYEISKKRESQRSTSAHNTLNINGKNSSDVWSSFRVGSRARIINSNFSANDKELIFEGSHNGYRNLKGAPIHNRKWVIKHKEISIIDYLQTSSNQNVFINYFLHPNFCLERKSDSLFFILNSGNNLIGKIIIGKKLHANIINTTWNYSFGKTLPNKLLRLNLKEFNSNMTNVLKIIFN